MIHGLQLPVTSAPSQSKYFQQFDETSCGLTESSANTFNLRVALNLRRLFSCIFSDVWIAAIMRFTYFMVHKDDYNE